MKAFLLAAGYGTRLRPVTDTVPKCMVLIRGKPLLGWWFDLLRQHGVNEVLVNTHYLPEQVREYIELYNEQQRELKIYEKYEPELYGNGGTVRENRSFVVDEDCFYICYADNLTDINLTEMLRFHNSHNGIMTMGLFHTDIPQQCGIVDMDHENRIISFEEKPLHPKSNLANAGIYIANQELFCHLKAKQFLDFGKDVIPELVGQMYGWKIKDYLLDIGTMKHYKQAQEEWKYDHYTNSLQD